MHPRTSRLTCKSQANRTNKSTLTRRAGGCRRARLVPEHCCASVTVRRRAARCSTRAQQTRSCARLKRLTSWADGLARAYIRGNCHIESNDEVSWITAQAARPWLIREPRAVRCPDKEAHRGVESRSNRQAVHQVRGVLCEVYS